MIFPLHCPLLLLFTSKYRIQDNFITPNGKIRNILSFISVTYMLLISVYYMYFDEADVSYISIHSDVINSFITFFSFISIFIAVLMIFVLNIVHANNNILFIVLIQTIHKSIDISKQIRSYIIGNWISAFIGFGVNCFILFGSQEASPYSLSYWLQITRNYMLTKVDIDCVYAIRVLVLLTNYLNEWIGKILKVNDEQENNASCVKLQNIYVHILEAYKLYTTSFKVLVSTTTLLL